jgi:dipeptidyl aminopeptidase/acylaminoacyl peptidase
MKKTTSIGNRFLILLTFIAIFLMAFVTFAPMRIKIKTQNKSTEIMPTELFTFHFSKPVNANEVEDRFTIYPAAGGNWLWLSDQIAQWQPSPGLIAGKTYTVSLAENKKQWNFNVRALQILTLQNTENGPELFTSDVNLQSNSRQLTFTQGNVIDYWPSPNGEWIILSVLNDENGADLWQMDRNAEHFQLFFNCGADQCLEVNWAPNNTEFVFSRYSSTEDGMVAQLQIANHQTSQVENFFPEQSGVISRAMWSPDGNRLAYWDASRNKVIVYDFADHLEYVLDGIDSYNACWSSDSERLYYTRVIRSTASYQNIVEIADIKNNQILPLSSEKKFSEGISFSSPVCHPFENRLAVTSQANVRVAGRTLGIIDLASMQETIIEDNLSTIPAYCSWSMDGQLLLYQVTSLDNTNNNQSVWIWQDNNNQWVCDECYNPKFLP